MLVRADRDLLEILDARDVAAAPDHELGLCHLDEAAADVAVAALDGAAHLVERDAVGGELVRVELDWYCRTWPPTLATSATPGTVWSSYRRCQSWSERSSARSWRPVRSTRAYS